MLSTLPKGAAQLASQTLGEHGISGLKHFDGDALAAEGDSNPEVEPFSYVIWDESRLTPDAAQIQTTYQLRAFHQRRYEQAVAKGETDLTAQQWSQVHTPEFKAWFGDWQKLRAEQRIDEMEPVELGLDEKYKNASVEELREVVVTHLRSLAKNGVKAVHPELGEVGFATNKTGKIVSTSAATEKLHATLDIVRVIEAAHLAGSEGSYKEKHKRWGGVIYHTLGAKTSAFGREFVTVITVEESASGSLFYNNIAVESGQKETPVAYPGKQQSLGGSGSPTAFTGAEEKQLAPLRRVNRESVSKAVNPRTGEPQVFYHSGGPNCAMMAASARWCF